MPMSPDSETATFDDNFITKRDKEDKANEDRKMN